MGEKVIRPLAAFWLDPFVTELPTLDVSFLENSLPSNPSVG